MGPLLELEHISKCYGRGLGECTVLRDVSLALEPGELVAIWGMRRSGRSTLLRVAAGLERPDSGVVRFAGRDLSSHRDDVLGEGIGYCYNSFSASQGQLVRDQLVAGQLARGVPPSLAVERAEHALRRCEAQQCASLRTKELKGAEKVRISIARTLVLRPWLIVIDEPTLDVDLLARDEILQLLRSIANEGIAVLASTAEATGLAGSDRALALGEGKLRGQFAPEQAKVLQLQSSRSAGSHSAWHRR